MKLLVLLALVGFTVAAVYQHQLTRIESKRHELIRKGKWQEYVRYRDSLDFFKKAAILKTVSQNVNDYLDTEYVGNVTVGTPDQTFAVVLDTGTANFFIPDTTCGVDPTCPTYCNDAATCPFLCSSTCCISFCDNKRKFNSSKSSTYVKNGQQWSTQIADGTITGFLGRDTVRFGDVGTNQLVVPKTTFAQATSYPSFIGVAPVDGFLGLAYTALASGNVIPPLINAINQGLLDKPLFTVYLEQRGLALNVPGGVYTYGAVDTQNCGDVIAYHPLNSATFYQFRMDKVGLGTYSVNSGWDTISNTGIAYIAGPQKITDNLAAKVGAVFNETLETYIIDCNAKFDPITLTIGGIDYHIDSKQMIVNTGGQCQFVLLPFEFPAFGPTWLLGDPWIRQYCNIYGIGDKNIGFAPPKNKLLQ